MIDRRSFLHVLSAGPIASAITPFAACAAGSGSAAAEPIGRPMAGEDIFAFLHRKHGSFNKTRYAQVLGAANEFKEGDEMLGVAAADRESQENARTLLANTRLADIDRHPVHADQLFQCINDRQQPVGAPVAEQTFGQVKAFLLEADGEAIQRVMPELSSDTIACVVKLLTNDQLIRISSKVFNPLPGTRIGAKGYLGARIQPNSPTDNLDDIRWQVFNGWAYAVGDVLLGTNPVSSDPASVAAIEATLKDLLTTFEINDLLPHCVLSHIDVQAQVEAERPGSTALWFQSIAGTDSANKTFDISVPKMQQYADRRSGRYGLYFETGQGADFTNGHGHGFDMVMHESRKYGFARALKHRVSQSRQSAGLNGEAWVHVNDVAGFIGPEVFRTRQQLVRCCLEDLVMGKLHGLCIGLDVCSTLHMDVSLEDLDWCLDQIMPANPAYLMALPTKIDPMLGYLTTAYQDHVRLREKFGYQVNDSMQRFFKSLGVLDQQGRPTEHFGDPTWVFLQYQRRKGDSRSDGELMKEAENQLDAVRNRGLFIAAGYGEEPWQMPPILKSDIARIYDDAKLSIWAELSDDFIRSIPGSVQLATKSTDRRDYILHPVTGEQLNDASQEIVRQLRRQQAARIDVQIVVSDGLNALAISEREQLEPFLAEFKRRLADRDVRVSPQTLVLKSGRVRAGYRIGELLFAGLQNRRAVAHVIGERPGSGHRTFSVYLTAAGGDAWDKSGDVDHNITKVVSGIALSALEPTRAAEQSVQLLLAMLAKNADYN